MVFLAKMNPAASSNYPNTSPILSRSLKLAMASLLAMGLFHHSAFAQEGETKLPSTIEAPDESAGQGQNTADEQSPSEGTPPSEVKSGVTGNGDMTDPNNPFNIPRFTLKSTSAYSAYQRGFYLTAFALATKQAGLGDIHAQTLLGELYLKGNGVEQDMKEAANWFEIAAEKGDREAQFNLGMLYAQGQGVPKDFEKALDYFQKAAAKNQPNAQFNLGLLYLRGQLVERDLTKAMDLLNKSAKQGDAAAQYALASLYQSDFFPAPNLEQASYWMQKSAEGGFLDAQLEYGLMLFHGKGGRAEFFSRSCLAQTGRRCRQHSGTESPGPHSGSRLRARPRSDQCCKILSALQTLRQE